MLLHQDPVLGYRVGAPYAVRVYDAAPAPKNKVPLQGPLRKVYSISNVYGSTYFLLKVKHKVVFYQLCIFFLMTCY